MCELCKWINHQYKNLQTLKQEREFDSEKRLQKIKFSKIFGDNTGIQALFCNSNAFMIKYRG
jgi:hypothetical protein